MPRTCQSTKVKPKLHYAVDKKTLIIGFEGVLVDLSSLPSSSGDIEIPLKNLGEKIGTV